MLLDISLSSFMANIDKDFNAIFSQIDTTTESEKQKCSVSKIIFRFLDPDSDATVLETWVFTY